MKLKDNDIHDNVKPIATMTMTMTMTLRCMKCMKSKRSHLTKYINEQCYS